LLFFLLLLLVANDRSSDSDDDADSFEGGGRGALVFDFVVVGDFGCCVRCSVAEDDKEDAPPRLSRRRLLSVVGVVWTLRAVAVITVLAVVAFSFCLCFFVPAIATAIADDATVVRISSLLAYQRTPVMMSSSK